MTAYRSPVPPWDTSAPIPEPDPFPNPVEWIEIVPFVRLGGDADSLRRNRLIVVAITADRFVPKRLALYLDHVAPGWR